MSLRWSSLQPLLTRRLVLPLALTATGSPYLRLLRQYRREQWLPTEARERLQLERVRQLLLHAATTTAYYRRVFAEVGFRPENLRSLHDLERIPPLTKPLVRKHFKELVSSAVPPAKLHQYATGGSTGTPLSFYLTPDREVRQAATIALNYEWAGAHLGDRMAMLWGAPFEEKLYQSLKGRLTNALLGRLFLPGFQLSDATFAQYEQRMRRFRPALLLGYKSLLLAFAKYLERNPASFPGMRSVMSGAETLYDHERTYLEKVFQVPVFNRYGGRDSGAVAAECAEEHRLHVNTNIVFVDVSPSQHILVTDLWNFGMPFIRYDTEDIGALSSKQCSCGRTAPTFAALEGRVHDLLVTPAGGYVPGEFFPHLMKDFAWVQQFQVVQDRVDHLTVRIVTTQNPLPQSDLEKIRGYIHQYFGAVQIDFTAVDSITPLPSGKHRFTVSLLHETPQ